MCNVCTIFEELRSVTCHVFWHVWLTSGRIVIIHAAKGIWRANDDSAAAMDKQRAKACYVFMLSTANISS